MAPNRTNMVYRCEYINIEELINTWFAIALSDHSHDSDPLPARNYKTNPLELLESMKKCFLNTICIVMQRIQIIVFTRCEKVIVLDLNDKAVQIMIISIEYAN